MGTRGVIVQALELALKLNQPVLVYGFQGARELVMARYVPCDQRVRLTFEGGEQVDVPMLTYLHVSHVPEQMQ